MTQLMVKNICHYPLSKKLISITGITVFLLVMDVNADRTSIEAIDNVIISSAFSDALRDGMSIPIFVHLDSNVGNADDLKIGRAFIWLDDRQLKIRKIQLEENDDGALLNQATRMTLNALEEAILNPKLTLPIGKEAWIKFNLRQMNLQLIIRKGALSQMLRARSEDIGESSVNHLSSTLNYNLGVFNNQMHHAGSNTSSYLSLKSMTAFSEHHIALDGSLYGLGSGDQTSMLYKAMYERDFNGYRFAAGMLDTWNLQSLGPVTAIPSGKIFGISWGNQASSTIFDNSQSAVPIMAFLPSDGEVHLWRDGRLLSVENFSMGNHEVDTSSLPYGLYDVQVEVIVNGKKVSQRQQRVNKLFSRDRSVSGHLVWQFWGGNLKLTRWKESDSHRGEKEDTWLMGGSASGTGRINWAATVYGFNNTYIGESRLTLPISDSITVNQQNMLASDGAWSSISSINATLPGGFSSLWISREKSSKDDKLRRNGADNRAIGGSLNLSVIGSMLGTVTASYNDENHSKTHYYTVDYYQNLYTGSLGSLGLRVGVQRYNNGVNEGKADKYFSLDFSLPLGNTIRTGMSHQNGYTTANVSARKQFNSGAIRSIGADVSRSINGSASDDKSLSGGAWAQYDTRYSAGTVHVNSSVDGYINTNMTSYGNIGLQGNQIAASGLDGGNAGVIFRTDTDEESQLSAKVNGRVFQIKGPRDYLPLAPYRRYEIELQNSAGSLDSFDITNNRKTKLTLYPGNVAIIQPGIKQIVTVFGRLLAEDGSLLKNIYINSNIGRSRTNDNGEFIIDVDKKYPSLNLDADTDQYCDVKLTLDHARGAIWMGDLICKVIKLNPSAVNKGGVNED